MATNEKELVEKIVRYLDRHTVMTLATVDSQGPHAVSLMYAREEFTLFWLSDPKVRHSCHIEPAAEVSVTVAGHYDDFKQIQGLQMRGSAGKVAARDEEKRAFDLLKGRYPFLKAFGRGELARHLCAASVYAFRPSTITFIDNSRGFGFKETLEL